MNLSILFGRMSSLARSHAPAALDGQPFNPAEGFRLALRETGFDLLVKALPLLDADARARLDFSLRSTLHLIYTDALMDGMNAILAERAKK